MVVDDRQPDRRGRRVRPQPSTHYPIAGGTCILVNDSSKARKQVPAQRGSCGPDRLAAVWSWSAGRGATIAAAGTLCGLYSLAVAGEMEGAAARSRLTML